MGYIALGKNCVFLEPKSVKYPAHYSKFNKFIFSVDLNNEINFTETIYSHKYFESLIHSNSLYHNGWPRKHLTP